MLTFFGYLSRRYKTGYYLNHGLYVESSWTIAADGKEGGRKVQVPLYWQADSTERITLSATLNYETKDRI